ncbi:UbiA family prenyltransferase [uncultured Methanomethylovorans sp.]|uniref:UbiA family prenyltransferase n=1 Tax=uncultured Methanomethylovorans sp. TaxID=183759 RepID=UPI002AA6BC2F|nr:UbiA family prenyltransferase [uncultured Methanomethylovorans sp.]
MINIYSYISIIKPKGCLTDVSVVAINCAILGILDYNFFLITFAGLLIHGCCNIMNDIFDFNIDEICKPNSAIRSGKLSMKRAWIYMGILLSAGLIVSLKLNFILFICLLLSFIIGGIMYSHPIFRLKDIPIIAILDIAICFSLESIGIWSVYSPLTSDAFVVALYIFILAFSLLFMKDFKDIAGDINSLPLMLGIEKAAWICSILTIFPLISLYYLTRYDNQIFVSICVYIVLAIGCIQILMDNPVSNGMILKNRMHMAFVIPNLVFFALKFM